MTAGGRRGGAGSLFTHVEARGRDRRRRADACAAPEGDAGPSRVMAEGPRAAYNRSVLASGGSRLGARNRATAAGPAARAGIGLGRQAPVVGAAARMVGNAGGSFLR